MVTTVRPKASEMPTRPMPTSGNLAASTALPQPPKTSQKVPNNSATARLAMGMVRPSVVVVRSGIRGGSLGVLLAALLGRRVDFRDPLVDGRLGLELRQVVRRHHVHGHELIAFDREGVGTPARAARLQSQGPLVLDAR